MPHLPRDEVIRALGGLAAVFGIWLIAAPYLGISQDAILYTAQALRVLHPENFSHDPFFAFGSQSQFTIFPFLHAQAIAHLGLGKAAFALTVAGKLAWFGGLVLFARPLLRGWAFWFGLLIVVTYTPYYSDSRLFSYGESFVTGRIFSEALTLIALGLGLRGKAKSALLTSLVAIALHPLLAIPGLAALFLLLVRRVGTIVGVVIVGLTAICTLALAGIAPFSGMLTTFDKTWFDIVTQRNSYVFVNLWDADSLAHPVFLATVLLMAALRLDAVTARLARVMLVVGALFMVGSLLGASILHNVLLTQLQLWRSLWLVKVSALLLLAGLTPVLWSGQQRDRMFLVVLWSAALLEGLPSSMLAAFGLGAWATWGRFAPGWTPTRTILAIFALIPLGGLLWRIVIIRYWVTAWRFFWERPAWQVVLSDTLVVAVLFAAALLLARRFDLAARRTVALLGVTLMAGGWIVWENPIGGESILNYPQNAATANLLKAVIPADATVYWPDNPTATWFWVERSNYVSHLQAAGVLFSQAAALEIRRRQMLVRQFGFRDGKLIWDGTDRDAADVPMPLSATGALMFVGELCRDPVLDFVIVPKGGVNKAIVSEFRSPFSSARLALVDCQMQRTDSR